MAASGDPEGAARAARLRDFLVESRCVDEMNVTALIDEEASREKLERALEELGSSTPRGGALLLYLRLPVGEHGLLPFDADPASPLSTALQPERLVELLGGTRGRRVFVLLDLERPWSGAAALARAGCRVLCGGGESLERSLSGALGGRDPARRATVQKVIFPALLLVMIVLAGLQLMRAHRQQRSGPAPGERLNQRDGSILVPVPAGEFLMGSELNDTERPSRRLTLPAFWIGKYEVTNGQFSRFVKDTGYRSEGFWTNYAVPGREDYPVVHVSWKDAAAYCAWAGGHLPSEAQWEKAARGADGRAYPWGDAWDPSRLNWCLAGEKKALAYDSGGALPARLPTERPGSYPGGASPCGAMDMAGNVWEWCGDWYRPYPGGKRGNPDYKRRLKVVRGGGWIDAHMPLFRCANRGRISSEDGSSDKALGFRICRDGDAGEKLP